MSKEIDNDMHKTVSQTDKNRKSPRRLRKRIIALSAAVVLILFGVWDTFIDPPVWWRSERQQDKKAILEYVQNKYPETIKRKGGKFPLQMPAGPYKNSVMYFELDGINFSVAACHKIIVWDTYYDNKAEKYICENYIDGFMNEKGLSPQINTYYRDGINEEIWDYKGHISIEIYQEYIDGAITPRQAGWFYDFYQYWIEICDLPDCAVTIIYRPTELNSNVPNYYIWFQQEKRTFSDENDFYKGFTR